VSRSLLSVIRVPAENKGRVRSWLFRRFLNTLVRSKGAGLRSMLIFTAETQRAQKKEKLLNRRFTQTNKQQSA